MKHKKVLKIEATSKRLKVTEAAIKMDKLKKKDNDIFKYLTSE